ncbi:MAG: peptidoglycan-associated lipoprotein Pal [Desulfobacterales bacterium]|jgi:peptidoglycan-associated lipoprotein|nr:peptidoglycan-associated lipoprotein Pal [Desulfobacteraceae bacterium]MBT4365278.1 peptidoglycan-associated lipoprotein Pal [Desulfobacteraceae bacterium]MBT7085052.1 peptidoglycan-associated lipoprotein Pal [Desulfobacterales bacterium]MBT7696781.1 peptidoglycan-associated lipoprotein Pal [Desulfobacterales bacterium]
MQKNLRICLALVLVVPGLLLNASCAKKPVSQQQSTTSMDNRAIQTDIERQRAEAAELAKMKAKEKFENTDIYFDYDESTLKSEAMEALKAKVEWLKMNPVVSVVIEGHCDERGSAEYNLALGDRRAESTKSFMVDMGIAADRLTKNSYGEEMPISSGNTEEAYAKNRRVHFSIE